MNTANHSDLSHQAIPEWLDRKSFIDCSKPREACGRQVPDSYGFDSRFDGLIAQSLGGPGLSSRSY